MHCDYDEDDNEAIVRFGRRKFPGAPTHFFTRNTKGNDKLFEFVDAAVERVRSEQPSRWGLCKIMVDPTGAVVSVHSSRERLRVVERHLESVLGPRQYSDAAASDNPQRGDIASGAGASAGAGASP